MAQLTILYVDDDEDIRDVAELSLQMDPGIEVRTAASGPEAMAVLEAWEPDLLMLDVMMPDMDGPTLLAAIRARPGRTAPPAIFITARVLAAELAQLEALGVAGVITKPFDPLTLAAQVRLRLAG